MVTALSMRRSGLMSGELLFAPRRHRLPQRRRAETHDLAVGNTVLSATIGFDEAGRPAEIFLSGAKDGSRLASILDDASVVISIALEHGIPARALAKAVARVPLGTLAPPDLDHSPGDRAAASVIGTALDLIATYEATA
jgi:hypothetical protein